MQGPIALSAALTLWGNAALSPRGPDHPHTRPDLSPDPQPGVFTTQDPESAQTTLTLPRPQAAVAAPPWQEGGLPADHTTIQFCQTVRFILLKSDGDRLAEVPYADYPGDWFHMLRTQGVTRLVLRHLPSPPPNGAAQSAPLPDRIGTAFIGGGGRWVIEAHHQAGADIWEGRWTSTPSSAEDETKTALPWSVRYGRIGINTRPPPPDLVDPATLRHHLSTTLEDLAAFAQNTGLPDYATLFNHAQVRLTSPDPMAGLHHADLFPPGWGTLEARQLMACAEAAWVFGGMGSWNDQMFDGETQEHYSTLSDTLFTLLIQAIVAAANPDFQTASTPEDAVPHRPWWKVWQ